MTDIIQLLPDSVANQIAAGEVIQRPASVVKELLENSLDAGATEIKLIIKDAGKTLIQVVDNGKGMSETDARMSFERHATSKIKKAEDIFNIRSMGFRGEALASIAAVAQTEMKTRQPERDLGVQINIEGSKVSNQEMCSSPSGTSIAVKNLFFNIPARRKFLKSNPVETKHIIDEFQRVALAHPEVGFQMYHNENEVFHLEGGSFRQRIVGIFGKNYNQKLVPIEENTNIVTLDGFIGKPETAKKTRGEQFLFVNNRFIKSPYLHHAIQASYDQLIPGDHHPSYFIKMDIDPKLIDINIHPTKTEIKFEDEKAIYAIIRSAVKQSLGKYNIAPSLDFDGEVNLSSPITSSTEIKQPTISFNPNFNPFEEEKKPKTKSTSSSTSFDVFEKPKTDNWESLYSAFNDERTEQIVPQTETKATQTVITSNWEQGEQHIANGNRFTYQLHLKYILTHIKSGLVVINQHRAHERIIYEELIRSMAHGKVASQQQLFPTTIELSAGDMELIKSLEEETQSLGFDLREFGKNCIVVHGIPADCGDADPNELLEGILEDFKNTLSDVKLKSREKLAMSLANRSAIKAGQKLSKEEMNDLIDQLFACEMPYISPSGLSTIVTLSIEEIEQKFDTK